MMRSTTLFFAIAISVFAGSSSLISQCWLCNSDDHSDCFGNNVDTSALLQTHPTWTRYCDNGCAKEKLTDNSVVARGCFDGRLEKSLCNTSEGYCAIDTNPMRLYCIYCCDGNKCNGAGSLTMSMAAAMATILAAFVLKA
ncbi:uncharacterized protein LOC117289999 [Asterias rubens]|uniref:uncharacterized protein LOC117289999 n=1 Tax=Asterias rubens TaxID=7604 RepID=UPI00145522E2|nr:uncharacterized protein LOC117289999 [Asterias rubens]